MRIHIYTHIYTRVYDKLFFMPQLTTISFGLNQLDFEAIPDNKLGSTVKFAKRISAHCVQGKPARATLTGI